MHNLRSLAGPGISPTRPRRLDVSGCAGYLVLLIGPLQDHVPFQLQDCIEVGSRRPTAFMPDNGKRSAVQQSAKSSPRLSTRLQCHRYDLDVVLCSSIAVYFCFQNLYLPGQYTRRHYATSPVSHGTEILNLWEKSRLRSNDTSSETISLPRGPNRDISKETVSNIVACSADLSSPA